jgi:hypothetical protein
VKNVWHGSWPDVPFFDLVKAAAVAHPELALDTFACNLRDFEAFVEPHKVEGTANPRNSSDEVEPSEDKI